jgi:hypothetical protein
MRQTRRRFKGEMEASGVTAGPATKWWSADTFAALVRGVVPFEKRVFQSGIRGREKSPSGATLKRVVTVLLRYCYGIAPMWVAQLTEIERLAKTIWRPPGTAPFPMNLDHTA